MRNVIYLISLILLNYLTGCQEKGSDVDYWEGPYIEVYHTPQRVRYTSQGLVEIDGEAIFRGRMYDALCEKNGDRTFKHKRFDGKDSDSKPFFILSQYVQRVSLIALQDFDEEHPYGSDVSEYVDISFYSVAAFIKNGYEVVPEKLENLLDDNNPIKRLGKHYGMMTYKMRMNEVNAKNSHLCGTEFYMKFAKKPEVKGLHRFKLIMQFEDCTLEKECTFNFE